MGITRKLIEVHYPSRYPFYWHSTRRYPLHKYILNHDYVLLTRSFGIEHGAFTFRTRVDDNALLVGGNAIFLLDLGHIV